MPKRVTLSDKEKEIIIDVFQNDAGNNTKQALAKSAKIKLYSECQTKRSEQSIQRVWRNYNIDKTRDFILSGKEAEYTEGLYHKDPAKNLEAHNIIRAANNLPLLPKSVINASEPDEDAVIGKIMTVFSESPLPKLILLKAMIDYQIQKKQK